MTLNSLMNIEHETQQLCCVNRTVLLNKYLVKLFALQQHQMLLFCYNVLFLFHSFLVLVFNCTSEVRNRFLFNFLWEQIKRKNWFYYALFFFYLKKEFCRIEGLAITRKINSLALESLTVVNCTWKVTLNYVYSLFSDLCHCR